MPDPRLLQIGAITPRMREHLAPGWTIDALDDQPDPAAWLRENGPGITGIVTGARGVPGEVAETCTGLRVVSSFGVGYDGIDAAALAARGVIVAHTPDVLNAEVADTFVMLWLAVSRRLIPAERWARSGDWAEKGNFPLARSVQNRRVGILGLGRIGSECARRAEAFGAEVHYTARAPKDVPYNYHADPVQLARAVEVLCVVTPGGEETRHLVGREAIEALGPQGILINISRGSVVDEAALVTALEEGRLGGAGLDVFEDEPHIPKALTGMEQVVLTPHFASATVETRRAMGDLVCENLMTYLSAGRVKTPVPECRALNAAGGS